MRTTTGTSEDTRTRKSLLVEQIKSATAANGQLETGQHLARSLAAASFFEMTTRRYGAPI